MLSQFQKMVQTFVLALFVIASVAPNLCAQRARFGGSGIDDFFALQQQPQPLTLPPPPTTLQFPQNGIPLPQNGLPQLSLPRLSPPVVQGFQQPPFNSPNVQPPGISNPLPGFDPFGTANTPFPIGPGQTRIPQGQFGLPSNLQPPNLQPPNLNLPPQGIVPQGIIPQNTAPQGFLPQGPPPAMSFQNNLPNRQFNPGFNNNLPFQPNRWPYEGTGSNWLPSIDWTWANQSWASFRDNFLPRVRERPRARQTWIQGNNGNELSINDLEVATTLTWPQFLGGRQPLRISPGFAAHWWNGPDSAVTGVDLPSRAYSAYLSFDHTTDPARGFGMDNNLTVGVYSDFDNLSSDSLRLTGRLVGWRRINEYMIGKIGVEYLDRIRLKLLPVVGIYANPNPDMKIDLAFPRSKISHRVPNFNNFEGWVYVGGEYGGGSWAIDRSSGMEDQVDINDVRAYLGMEWMGPRRVTGFFEFGYVFERELVYRSNPLFDVPIQDSLMIRSGFAF